MFDEPLGDRFPNSEQRLVRRADLFRELLKFLDDFKESPDDGWPELTREDHHALYAIFGEIIDLKFGRDCDGDRSITYSIDPKQRGSAVYYTIPYFRGEIEDTTAFMEWLGNASDASRMASSYADSAAKNVSNTVSQRNEYDRKRREREILFASLPEKISGLPFDEAAELMVESHGATHGFDEYHLLEAGQAAMAERFVNELNSGVALIATAMAEFKSEEERGFYTDVRQPRTRLQRIFGKAFTQHPDILTRSNELFRQGAEDRRIRNLRRKCVHDFQKTDNWLIDRCSKCGEERA